jgi:hypothetical protein
MVMRGLRRFAMLGLLGALSACTLAAERPSYPELTWSHLPPIALDVAEIEIVDASRPTGASPHVEHLFPLPPAEAAGRWARDRLRAAGLANRARFIIQRADVIEVGLKRTEGFYGIFTTDQSERYDGVLGVALEIRSDTGALLGQVTAETRKSHTVAENASLNQREAAWFEMTDEMIKLLNAEMERVMPLYLGRWIRPRQ